MKKQKGFTLVEMLISLAVGTVILAAVYAMVNIGQKSTANVERKVSAHQDARSAMDVMAMEIQMASYNPRPDLLTSTFWKASTSCGASTYQGQKGIQGATPNAITLQMNLDASANIADTANVTEMIRYNYDSYYQFISRQTWDCAANTTSFYPFLGNYSWNPRALRVINTANVPVFRYFDAQGAEIPSASLITGNGAANIARIDITLWVETEEVYHGTGKRKQIVYTTSIIPRNHVLNR